MFVVLKAASPGKQGFHLHGWQVQAATDFPKFMDGEMAEWLKATVC